MNAPMPHWYGDAFADQITSISRADDFASKIETKSGFSINRTASWLKRNNTLEGDYLVSVDGGFKTITAGEYRYQSKELAS